MTSQWKTFLFRRLPVAIVTIGLLVEGAAYLLREAAPLRHPLDRLVASLDRLPAPADVILLGDSVTQDIAGQFDLSGVHNIADLTTNKASGLIGSYFLVRRYLALYRKPSSIVIAATPEFFGYTPSPTTADFYLTTVFRRPLEQSELKQVGLPPRKTHWRPAIFDFESQIFNRIAGTVFRKSGDLNSKLAKPDDAASPEPPGGNAAQDNAIDERRNSVMEVSQNAAFAMQRLCSLSARMNFTLNVVWAPAPASAHKLWRSDGRLDRLRDRLTKATEGACFGVTFTDINDLKTFPDHAFRDPDHLRRPGWAALYAQQLKRFLNGL